MTHLIRIGILALLLCASSDASAEMPTWIRDLGKKVTDAGNKVANDFDNNLGRTALAVKNAANKSYALEAMVEILKPNAKEMLDTPIPVKWYEQACRDCLSEKQSETFSGYAQLLTECKAAADRVKELSKNKETLLQVRDKAIDAATSLFTIPQKAIAAGIEAKKESAVKSAEAKVYGEYMLQAWKSMFEPQNLRNIAVCATAVIGGYFVLKYAYRYAQSKMNKPSLLKNSSLGWKTPQEMVRNLIWKPAVQSVTLTDIVLPADVEQEVKDIVEESKIIREQGKPYQNILLYGPPGTGKTMFAQRLAQGSNMDWVKISGSDFSQFFGTKTEVQELDKLLDAARQSPRGTIIFIDEAEGFLGDRSKMSEQAQRLLLKFLTETGDLSNKIMLVFATNCPDALDNAIHNRIDRKVFYAPPSKDERKKLFVQYLGDQHGLTAEELDKIAQCSKGLVGRDIAKIANRYSIVKLKAEHQSKKPLAILSTLVAGRMNQDDHAKGWTMKDHAKNAEVLAPTFGG